MSNLQVWRENLRKHNDVIFIHDWRKPLRKRLESRKYVGPYMWKPTAPGSGRGFYLAAHGLETGDSTFRLRLEWANDHISGRTADITGYYTDEFQHETAKPIIARLPHGRGFLAGYTLGNGMASAIEPEIYADAESAAYAAHSVAERVAEDEREYREREAAKEGDEDEESE